MFAHRKLHGGPVGLPTLRRALDVGEHEGHRSAGPLCAQNAGRRVYRCARRGWFRVRIDHLTNSGQHASAVPTTSRRSFTPAPTGVKPSSSRLPIISFGSALLGGEIASQRRCVSSPRRRSHFGSAPGRPPFASGARPARWLCRPAPNAVSVPDGRKCAASRLGVNSRRRCGSTLRGPSAAATGRRSVFGTDRLPPCTAASSARRFGRRRQNRNGS